MGPTQVAIPPSSSLLLRSGSIQRNTLERNHPLQALVNKGQLIVPGGRSKSHLLGFHDPVMGEKKHLLIIYAFRGTLHKVVVEDFGEVAAPMRMHQLS